MRIINIVPNHIGAVDIGFQGENEATQVRIPIPASCAGYSATLYIQPPSGNVYPASLTEIVGGVVIWTVSSADTIYAGDGEIQLRFYEDGKIVKMTIYPIRIRRSIDSNPGPTPEPIETWLDTLTDLAEETAGYAAEAAEDAQEIRSMSATAETLEPGAAATASYADGVLSLGIPSGLRGPQGETGERGPRGETGATGPRGETGATGQRGEQGPKGDAFTYADFTPEQLAGLTGPQGERGPAGPQGERGLAGPQGIQGIQGETGATPDFTIGTVTTGAAGTDATATITGTPESPVLNLTIPRGDPGEVTQAELDAAIDALCPQKTVGPSALVSVTDAWKGNALDVIIGIEPVQSGSGDPSPENVRPITGWTGATLTVYQSDPTDTTTYSTDWSATAGTVYDGSLDVTTGVLTVDRAMVEFDGSSDETWQYYSVTQGHLFRSTNNPSPSINNANKSKFLCSQYVPTESRTDGTLSSSTASYLDFINNSITSLDAWRLALSANPVTVIYPIAVPIVYQLMPQQVALLLGANALYADTGDTTLTYRRDIAIILSNL